MSIDKCAHLLGGGTGGRERVARLGSGGERTEVFQVRAQSVTCWEVSGKPFKPYSSTSTEF